MKTLDLERRGCEFNMVTDAALALESDVRNYRVCTPGYDVYGKNGRDYFLEFTRYDAKEVSPKARPTTLNPKINVVMKNALHIDTAYETADGCFRDCEMESQLHSTPQKFTTESILNAVNEIAAEPYDTIRYVYTFSVPLSPDDNPTPRDLIRRHAVLNHLQTSQDAFGTLILNLYSGDYMYDHWVQHTVSGTEMLTVYLVRL